MLALCIDALFAATEFIVEGRGTLVVTDSGWTQTTVVKYRVGGSANPNGDTLSLGGGWAVTGSSVTLLDAGSTVYTGTFTSTSMTLTTKTATVLGYSK